MQHSGRTNSSALTGGGKPRTMTGLEEPDVDRDLLHHMCMSTDMLVNDSASPELLAGEVSRGRRGSESVLAEAFTPHVKIVGRDLAHGARYVLKKPWQEEPTLSNLVETAIWHNTRWFRTSTIAM